MQLRAAAAAAAAAVAVLRFDLRSRWRASPHATGRLSTHSSPTRPICSRAAGCMLAAAATAATMASRSLRMFGWSLGRVTTDKGHRNSSRNARVRLPGIEQWLYASGRATSRVVAEAIEIG